MFTLVNGKPKFYIGKINGIGYTDDKDREEIIKRLKEENEDIELIDEEIIIDEDIKKKAIALGELGLTYSKSEFLQYLNGEKPIPGEDAKDLKMSMVIGNMEMYKTIEKMKADNALYQNQMMMEMLNLIETLSERGDH